MKFKTTIKAVKYNYYKVIEVGYCDLSHLLTYENAVAYTSGVYGWNSDIYDLNDITGYNVCISTGYRPISGIKIDYTIIHDYNKKADSIIYNHDLSYTEKKAALRNLINDLVINHTDIVNH